MKCLRNKNPCKICFQTCSKKNGIQCQGACRKWAHFKCLNYTPGKIQDIKAGIIKVTCPCPDCNTFEPKEILADPPFTCTNIKCPANTVPICESQECPSKENPIPTYPPPPFEYSPKSSEINLFCPPQHCDPTPKCCPSIPKCPPAPKCLPSKCPPPTCASLTCSSPTCPPATCPPPTCPPTPCHPPESPSPKCPPPTCTPPKCPSPKCPPPKCPPECNHYKHSERDRSPKRSSKSPFGSEKSNPPYSGSSYCPDPQRCPPTCIPICPPTCPSYQIMKKSQKECSPKQSQSCSDFSSNSNASGKQETGHLRTICSDSKILNSGSTDQKMLFSALEDLCNTVGQLSCQLKELMCKMQKSTQ